MKITSTAFINQGLIPERYSCEGNNISPPLEIIEPPLYTQSFAIIMHDHDAPIPDFVHWLVWNIPPLTKNIAEATIPVGAIEGTNDMHKLGWTGPCPPSGKHRYEFHLYALDKTLTLPMTSTKEDLRREMEEHILLEASITGLYSKSAP